MARQAGAAAAHRQQKFVLQPRVQRGGLQHAQLRRDEFDGHRDAVETAANAGDRRGVGIGEAEPRHGGGRAFDEQPHGVET